MEELLKSIYGFNDIVLGACTIFPAFIQFYMSIPDIKKAMLKRNTQAIKISDILGISLKIICFLTLVFVGLCSIVKNCSTFVPRVKDMSLEDAVQTLNELGIKFSSDVPPNKLKEYYVVEQSIGLDELIWDWETLVLTTEKYDTEDLNDGVLKLTFYDGSFSYRSSQSEANFYYDDIIEKGAYSFFYKSISPTVYITIIDSNGEVYDTKSEYTNEYTIPLKYGNYKIQVSGKGYQNYTVNLSLNYDNKESNVWNHNVYLIPNQFVVHDLKIRVFDSNQTVCSSRAVFIGYNGYTLSCNTDENGYIEFLFTLSKGDYIVGLENCPGTHFFVNETYIDESEITIYLTD